MGEKRRSIGFRLDRRRWPRWCWCRQFFDRCNWNSDVHPIEQSDRRSHNRVGEDWSRRRTTSSSNPRVYCSGNPWRSNSFWAVLRMCMFLTRPQYSKNAVSCEAGLLFIILSFLQVIIDVLDGFDGVASGDVVLVIKSIGAVTRCPNARSRSGLMLVIHDDGTSGSAVD